MNMSPRGLVISGDDAHALLVSPSLIRLDRAPSPSDELHIQLELPLLNTIQPPSPSPPSRTTQNSTPR